MYVNICVHNSMHSAHTETRSLRNNCVQNFTTPRTDDAIKFIMHNSNKPFKHTIPIDVMPQIWILFLFNIHEIVNWHYDSPLICQAIWCKKVIELINFDHKLSIFIAHNVIKKISTAEIAPSQMEKKNKTKSTHKLYHHGQTHT